MSDPKDPAIKLFGRTIPLQEGAAGPPEADADADEDGSDPRQPPEPAVEVEKVQCKDTEDKEDNNMKLETPKELENVEANSSSTLADKKEDQEKMSIAEVKAAADPKGEHVKTASDESGQDKVLKKPDKILPCPRCNSMETKFCYYNNYNVNQPRHFCKNCQRYWTAGGTMRNVPVGAGRRKSKNSSLHYRHMLMPPDGLMGCQAENPNSMNHEALASSPSILRQPIKRNETILKFGPEVPLCESMTSVLNIEEQKVTNFDSVPGGENKDENSCASPVTAYNGLPESTVHNHKNGVQGYSNGVAPLPEYYLGASFMYPWSLGWNNLPTMVLGRSIPESACASESCSTSSVPWINSHMMRTSRFSAPAFPFPLMPPALWGCLSSWLAPTSNVPWIGTNGCVSPSSSSNSSCSGNGSPTLGKHSRDSNLLKEEKKEKSLWFPKTLRIDDPHEAAKSSIWATLGIKPGERGVFKPFQSKAETKGQTSDAAQVLQANPAALSRSQSFQESS